MEATDLDVSKGIQSQEALTTVFLSPDSTSSSTTLMTLLYRSLSNTHITINLVANFPEQNSAFPQPYNSKILLNEINFTEGIVTKVYKAL